MNLDPSTLLLAGGLGGVLYSMKSYIFTAFNKLKNRFMYTVNVYQYDELFMALEKWLYDKHSTSYREVEAVIEEISNSERKISGGIVSQGDGETIKKLTYKQESTAFLIKYEGKRILINKTKEKMEKAENAKDYYFRRFIISGFKAKKTINSLLEEVLKYTESKHNNGIIKVYANTSWGDWYAPRFIRTKALDKVILKPETKSLIINDVEEFINSEQWYNDININYKRGLCFYGPPGTGKTTLALALAAYTKRSVFCMNLNSIADDSKIPYMFNELKQNSILLLEDIDKVFSGRENVNPQSKITFSTLLNCLDGAFAKHGLITIITTNHIEKLDPALLRTGRMDIKIEVPKPGQEEIEEYLSVFYGKKIELGQLCCFELTMSDIQEICLKNKSNSDNAIQEILNKTVKLIAV